MYLALMLDQGLSELVPMLHSRISQLFLPLWNQPSIARYLDNKKLSQQEKNPVNKIKPLSQREKISLIEKIPESVTIKPGK